MKHRATKQQRNLVFHATAQRRDERHTTKSVVQGYGFNDCNPKKAVASPILRCGVA